MICMKYTLEHSLFHRFYFQLLGDETTQFLYISNSYRVRETSDFLNVNFFVVTGFLDYNFADVVSTKIIAFYFWNITDMHRNISTIHLNITAMHQSSYFSSEGVSIGFLTFNCNFNKHLFGGPLCPLGRCFFSFF